MPDINLKKAAGVLGDFIHTTDENSPVQIAENNGRGISISENFNQRLSQLKKRLGNNVQSELVDLVRGAMFEPIIYPSDLDEEHFTVFRVIRRTRKDRTAPAIQRSVRSIILPVPNNLQVQYNLNYSNEGLGLMGGVAAGRFGSGDVASAAGTLQSRIGERIEAGNQAFEKLDSNDSQFSSDQITKLIDNVMRGTISASSGLMALRRGQDGGVFDAAKFARGLTINPHMAVLFRGIDFRTHQFSYRLVARNQKESDNIKELISTFKYHMHPDYTLGNLAWTYPEEFEIDFSQAIAPNLYRIGTCVLTGFDVNYNGENIPLFFEDTGAPVAIDITLNFQETELVTKRDTEPSFNTQLADRVGF